MIAFFKAILRCNVKRSNIQVRSCASIRTEMCTILIFLINFRKTDDALVSGDGFILNLLSVLQELSNPIKKEKVELMALFCSEISPLYLTNDEAKINCSKETFIEFVNTLGAGAHFIYFNFIINKAVHNL